MCVQRIGTSKLVPVHWYQLLVPETGQSDMAFSLC